MKNWKGVSGVKNDLWDDENGRLKDKSKSKTAGRSSTARATSAAAQKGNSLLAKLPRVSIAAKREFYKKSYDREVL